MAVIEYFWIARCGEIFEVVIHLFLCSNDLKTLTNSFERISVCQSFYV